MKRADPKPGKSVDDLDAAHGLKIAEHRSDEGVVNCTETSSISTEVVGIEEESNGVKLRRAGQSNQFEEKTNSGHDPMHDQTRNMLYPHVLVNSINRQARMLI